MEALIFWLIIPFALPLKRKETGVGLTKQTAENQELFDILANLPIIIINIVNEFR